MPTWITLLLLPCAPFLSAAGVLQYEVLNSYPHDPAAFTQGLFYEAGVLYESTGLYGESSLRRVDLKTGRVRRQIDLDETYFGEGATVFQGKLYQLTWQAGECFVYDPKSLEQLDSFRYEGEGWGLTHDDEHLILSDGTDRIRFLDPKGFAVVRSIDVRLGERPVKHLNELEYVDGSIYANVWHQDVIVRIDPKTGRITGFLNLSKLWPERPDNPEAVLNGIAYDAGRDAFLVTGKLWSKLFAIRLKP